MSAKSDEEISDMLLSLAERMAPLTPEAELDLFGTLDRWDRRAEESISDEVIDQWFDRSVERAIRNK